MSTRVDISIPNQRLRLTQAGGITTEWPISTAAKGVGQQSGSECTPQGRHQIRARIGHGLPLGAVLVGRRWTGEVWTPELEARFPGRDWILTRIMWLSGLEPGKNRLGNVDTMRRYIYIHGCPDTTPMGIVGSHGCVRMRNIDVVSLFDQVAAGTEVVIHA